MEKIACSVIGLRFTTKLWREARRKIDPAVHTYVYPVVQAEMIAEHIRTLRRLQQLSADTDSSVSEMLAEQTSRLALLRLCSGRTASDESFPSAEMEGEDDSQTVRFSAAAVHLYKLHQTRREWVRILVSSRKETETADLGLLLEFSAQKIDKDQELVHEVLDHLQAAHAGLTKLISNNSSGVNP